MSVETSDLNAAIVLQRINSGELPRDSVLMVARGLLPFAQEDLVSIVSQLATHDDEEIAATARETLLELPPAVLIGCARNPDEKPEVLDALARVVESEAVLEAVARNRSTPDDTLLRLAASAGPNLQEILIVNQERLLRTPSLIDSLLANSSLSVDVRRRALEFQDEFFVKKKAIIDFAALEAETLSEEDELLMAELIELARKAEETAAIPSTAQIEESDPDKLSIWSRIGKMNVADKVKIAFKAGPTERGILIRDRNKMVCTAVIRSPKITDSEAEAFAGLRNVDEEVLRLIGNNRQWMSKYPIMIALARNPKAPIAVVLGLLNRITLKDVKALMTDKGVSEVVRTTSKRLYIQRKKVG